MAKATQPGELVDRVQELTARLDGLEPEVRDTAFELRGSLMELYGRGLERILEGLPGRATPSSSRPRQIVRRLRRTAR
jgi:hypothetical protein